MGLFGSNRATGNGLRGPGADLVELESPDGALLTAIWFWASPDSFFWPIFAIGGMGIGAYFQWMEAYGPGLKKVITEADIDAELERLKRKG